MRLRPSQPRVGAALVLTVTLLFAVRSVLANDAETDGESSATRDGATGDLSHYVEVNASALPDSNTIATKLDVPLQQTPANVGVVGRPLIDEQNAVVLGDALQNVSSINVQAGPAVHDFFTVRGFNSLDGVLVLTDGAIEPEATFYHSYNIEGVEVLKGPGGFLYGRYPLAGTVNMARKQPMPTPFTTLSAYGGSFGTFEAALDSNQTWNRGASSFRLNGVLRGSDGYRDQTDSRYGAINPSFSFKPDEETTFNFNLEYVSLEVSPDSGLPLIPSSSNPSESVIPDVSRTQSYQSPVDFSDQQIGRFQFDFEKKLSDSVTLRNKLYYRGLDWQSAGTLLSGSFPIPGDVLAVRTLTTLDDRQEYVGDQFEALISARTGSVEHRVLAGVELTYETDEFKIDVLPPEGFLSGNPADTCNLAQNPALAFGMPCISVFNPLETFSEIPAGLVPLDAGDARNRVIAPYVVDEMSFSSKFHLLVGLRYDFIDFEDDLKKISRDDSELSPMIGAVWSPDPSFSLYGNAGRAHAPASARLGNNSELEPEQSTQLELGVKEKFLDDKMQAAVAVYQIDRENLAIVDANGFTQQAGDQRSRGVEFDLAAEPAPRLHTFFSVSYTDAELTRFNRCEFPTVVPCPVTTDLSGNRPAYAPEWLGRLWVSQKFRNGFGVGGGARYVGSQYFNPDNAFELDAYLLLDLVGFYDWKDWRFQLNVKNLTDQEYETGSFGSSSVVPGEPFSVFGRVEYRF